VPDFATPHVVAAPRRCGPGAAAGALGGAFTAVSDDATAAAWNPGALPALEGAGVYASARWSRSAFRHESGDADFAVSEDRYDGMGLDFLGAFLPFRLFDRDCVAAASCRPAFDFTQRFTADLRQAARETRKEHSTRSDGDGVRVAINIAMPPPAPAFAGALTGDVTTRRTSELTEVITSDVTTSLRFAQDGAIDAFGPSLGVALGPRCSVGAAMNLYVNNLFTGRSIVSRTAARYSGSSEVASTLVEEKKTEGDYTYRVTDGVVVVAGGGDFDMFSDTTETRSRRAIRFEGEYEETSEYSDLFGASATLGVLCKPVGKLRAGMALDLPWRARATHTTSVRSSVTTLDSSGQKVLGVSETADTQTRGAVLAFPASASVGAGWNWTESFLTSLDVRHTQWSRFSYSAGGGKLNPLDGSPYGEHAIADCWSVGCGAELLVAAGKSAGVPLRCGLSWDQQPAIGKADSYWSASLGSGVTLGKGEKAVVLDAGYTYSRGADVLGTLVPAQQGLATDAATHGAYVACSGSL
jgi:hypothetical protein